MLQQYTGTQPQDRHSNANSSLEEVSQFFYKCLYLETRVVAAVLYEEVKGQLQNANRSKSGSPLQELKRCLKRKRSSLSVSINTGGEKR